VGNEVLTAVVMKSSVFCHITRRSSLKVDLRFRATACNNKPSKKSVLSRRQAERMFSWSNSKIRNLDIAIACFASACWLLHAGFFLGSFFDADDGGDMFRRHVGWLSADCTELYPVRLIFHDYIIQNDKGIHFNWSTSVTNHSDIAPRL
jgi:hypothetical protein